ncbi:hypothetical protein QE152_g32562 [Popillia japonica]|uniref:CST complex subunit Stn1 N-terminal domain-containing protein n=1 Tax=Popillia japonica TaxID=7064 RepID=A0AAW1IYD5_POPJA
MDDNNGDDIIQKYLPIFLSLRQEAENESRNHESQSGSKCFENSPDIFESDNQLLPNNIESRKNSQISSSANATPKRLILNDENVSEEANQELGIDTELDDFLNDELSDSIFARLSDVTTDNQAEDIEEEFPTLVTFPNNSRLHQCRILAEKRAKTKIPILFIKDILNARHWKITHSSLTLTCDCLYECDHAIFGFLICRGTIVGINPTSLTVFVEDGTGRLECRLDHEKFEDSVGNAKIDNSPIIHEFDAKSSVEYQCVTSIKWLQRGDIVQILGKLRIYNEFRVVYVNKLCKEAEMSIPREFKYIDVVNRFYAIHLNSKKYYQICLKL